MPIEKKTSRFSAGQTIEKLAKEKKNTKEAGSIFIEEEEVKKVPAIEKTAKGKKAAVTEVKAHLRYLRISERKVKLVSDAVKGLFAEEALKRLQLINKRAARPVAKLISSAVASADHNFHISKDNLVVKNIIIGQGPTLKRNAPAAFGSAHLIRKRSAHVTVILGVKTEKQGKEKKKLKIKNRNS